MGFPSATNNFHDSNAYFPYGMSVVDYGLVVQYGINGVGLLTMGLVWQAYDIWGPGQPTVTTTWTADNDGNELPYVQS